MDIYQLSVRYLAEQDRLLVRINTHTHEELRLWLTRRLVLDWWPALQQHVLARPALDGAPDASLPRDPDARGMLADFARQQAVAGTDFDTPYRDEAASLPLGAEPLLVTQLQMTWPPHAPLQVDFEEKIEGRSGLRRFQLALQPPLVHALMHLLQQEIARAQWQDSAQPPRAADAPAAEASPPPRPRYLN